MLLVLTCSSAVIGSLVNICLRQKRLDRNLNSWYLISPIMAAVIASIGYIILRNILIVGGPNNVSSIGVAALGLFVNEFTAKIRDVIAIVRDLFDEAFVNPGLKSYSY